MTLAVLRICRTILLSLMDIRKASKYIPNSEGSICIISSGLVVLRHISDLRLVDEEVIHEQFWLGN